MATVDQVVLSPSTDGGSTQIAPLKLKMVGESKTAGL
jgi:hypothetical protein